MANRYQFINGTYSATWNGAAIGTSENGFTIEYIPKTQLIHVDEAGGVEGVPVDGIDLGTEARITLKYAEYYKIKAALLSCTGNIVQTGIATVGNLRTGEGKSLVLTPQNSALRIYTAPCALVMTDTDILLSSNLRGGACVFYCFPDPTASGNSTANSILESGGSIG